MVRVRLLSVMVAHQPLSGQGAVCHCSTSLHFPQAPSRAACESPSPGEEPHCPLTKERPLKQRDWLVESSGECAA